MYRLIALVVIGVLLGVSCIFSAQIESALGIGKSASSGNQVSVSKLEDDNFVVHYINVDQADCTFIELPDGTNMVIDAGDLGTRKDVVNYIQAVLGEGNNKINHLVLTHSDQDHIGGAGGSDPDSEVGAGLFYNFEIENIYRPFAIAGNTEHDALNDLAEDAADPFVPYAYDELGNFYLDMLDESNYGTRIAENALKLPRVKSTTYKNVVRLMYEETFNGNPSNIFVNYEGLTINSRDSHHPYSIKWYAPLTVEDNGDDLVEIPNTLRTKGYVTKGYTVPAKTGKNAGKYMSTQLGTGKNAISPVIKLEYLGKKFVFTGDIYEVAERDVAQHLSSIEKTELSNVTVYQAGHHGAKNSSTAEFLEIINPTWTVVSCGLNNSYNHPNPEFLARIDALDHTVSDYLLRTDLNGNIIFGVSDTGQVDYNLNTKVEKKGFEIEWWHIAVGIFVVSGALIFGIQIKFVDANKRRKNNRKT
ncbi:MAG: MBL fold metallo-hydrolase [Clostridia bacterium]|nr:MBL fold metallo-hydrolase [Clostridia bacterium]